MALVSNIGSVLFYQVLQCPQRTAYFKRLVLSGTKTVILTRAQVKGNAFLKKMREGAFQQNKQSEVDSIENNNNKNHELKTFLFLFNNRNTKMLPRSKALERRKDTCLCRKQQ